MSVTTTTTQITYKYLMNKTKDEIADLALWILDIRNKESVELEKLKGEVDFLCVHRDQLQKFNADLVAKCEEEKLRNIQLSTVLDECGTALASMQTGALKAENERLRDDLDNCRDDRNNEVGNGMLKALVNMNAAGYNKIKAALADAEAENERLRAVLVQYADGRNWHINSRGVSYWTGDDDTDGPDIARRALGGEVSKSL